MTPLSLANVSTAEWTFCIFILLLFLFIWIGGTYGDKKKEK